MNTDMQKDKNRSQEAGLFLAGAKVKSLLSL